MTCPHPAWEAPKSGDERDKAAKSEFPIVDPRSALISGSNVLVFVACIETTLLCTSFIFLYDLYFLMPIAVITLIICLWGYRADWALLVESTKSAN